MNKNELLMPRNYLEITREGQRNIYGGYANIPVTRQLLSKASCRYIARRLVNGGYYGQKVSGMTVTEIAQEIYAHAKVYYQMSALTSVLNIGILNDIKAHASVVDIEDGGDLKRFKAAYSLIWNMG